MEAGTYQTDSLPIGDNSNSIRTTIATSHLARKDQKTMNNSMKVHSPAGLRGVELLDTPIWNKGTAFDETERMDSAVRSVHGVIGLY